MLLLIGRAWSAVTTEGLLTFTLDNKISFNPFDLSCDVTPKTIKEAIKAGSYSLGLVLSLRLNEYPLILEALEAVPMKESMLFNYCHFNAHKNNVNVCILDSCILSCVLTSTATGLLLHVHVG